MGWRNTVNSYLLTANSSKWLQFCCILWAVFFALIFAGH